MVPLSILLLGCLFTMPISSSSFSSNPDSSHTLLIPSEKSLTHQPIYQDEYGVCILATADVEKNAIGMNKQFFHQYPTTAPIRPHLTLLQGRFNEIQLEQVKYRLQEYVKHQSAFKIVMKQEISKGSDSMTFWFVDEKSPSWKKLYEQNNYLSSHPKGITHPVALTKQVEDALKEKSEIMNDVMKFGRHFSIPTNFYPHITICYERYDSALVTQINHSHLVKNSLSFTATELSLARIDNVGNVYDIIEQFKFSD